MTRSPSPRTRCLSSRSVRRWVCHRHDADSGTAHRPQPLFADDPFARGHRHGQHRHRADRERRPLQHHRHPAGRPGHPQQLDARQRLHASAGDGAGSSVHHQQLLGRVRPLRRRRAGRGRQDRRQPGSRQRLRLPEERQAERQQLGQQPEQRGARPAAAQRIRIYALRPRLHPPGLRRTEQDVLLLQLGTDQRSRRQHTHRERAHRPAKEPATSRRPSPVPTR